MYRTNTEGDFVNHYHRRRCKAKIKVAHAVVELNQTRFPNDPCSHLARHRGGEAQTIKDSTQLARYLRGDNITLANGASGQSEWERDLEAAYTVQSGPLKDLSFRVRQATYRNSFSGDLDDVRFITQYPINL